MVGFINLKFIDYDKDGNITVQYVSYSPVGSLSPTCGIGGTLRVVRLTTPSASTG